MVSRSCSVIGRNSVWGLKVAALAALSVLCMCQALPAADAILYYADGREVELEAVTDHVTIEISPSVPQTDVAVALAGKGMPTLISPTYCLRNGTVRLVPVPAGVGTALAEVRQIPGIKQARKLYRNTVTGQYDIATDQIVVRFKPDVGDGVIAACLADYGVATVRTLPALGKTYVVRVLDPAGDAVQVAAAMYQDESTYHCQPDFVLEVKPAQFTDTYYPNQWHLNSTGLQGAAQSADVNWPEAWALVASVVRPSPIRLAVLDDSVQYTHEDLNDAFVAGFDLTDRDSDPSPGTSQDNHGTAVAGVALARINGIGVIGAAPTASLIGIRWGLTISDMSEGFLFAYNQNADVINNSWGPAYLGASVPDALREAIDLVLTQGRGGKGMIVLFAAGNEYTTITLGNPIAALPGVIAVGASNSLDQRSFYSNFGPELSVVAPSNDFLPGTLGITTTDVEDDANLPTQGYNQGTGVGDLPNGNYTETFGGTSSASPLTAGVAALILRANPALQVEEVRKILEQTADKIDAANAGYDSVTGHSLLYGHGRVNAAAAVSAALQGIRWPPPVRDLSQNGTSTVRLRWNIPVVEDEAGRVRSVMVVESTAGPVAWSPAGIGTEDPEDYTVGQRVAPNTKVVENDLVSSYDADPGPGVYDYAVFTRNLSGRWSTGRTVRANLTGKSAPLASISATPRSGEAPLVVNFNGGAVDPDLENVDFTYSWDFGDGTSMANQQSTPHTFNTSGDYLVELEVTDETLLTGTARVMIRVLDEPHQPPTARISLSPGDGEAPHTVRLQGSATVQPGQSIDQYIWTFGDGTAAAGQIVEHTYINPGAYTITLEVVDNLGTSAKAAIALSVWSAEPTTGTPKPSTGSETGAEGCGACGAAGLPTLIASMLGWGLLGLRRRRY